MQINIKQVFGLLTQLVKAKLVEYPYTLEPTQTDGICPLVKNTFSLTEFSAKVVDSATAQPSTLTVALVVNLSVYSDSGTLKGTGSLTIPINSGAMVTFTLPTPVTMAAGDVIVIRPAVAVQTGRRISVTVAGTR